MVSGLQMNELAINKTTRATSVSPLGTVETKARLDNGLRRYAAGRRLANGRHVRVALRYHMHLAATPPPGG